MSWYKVSFTVEDEIGIGAFGLRLQEEYIDADSAEKAALFIDRHRLRKKGRRRGKINSVEEVRVETAYVDVGGSYIAYTTPQYTTVYTGALLYDPIHSYTISTSTPVYADAVRPGNS